MRKEYFKSKEIDIVNRKFSDTKFDGQVFTTRMDPTSMAVKYPTLYPIVSDRHTPRAGVEYEGEETDSDNVVGIATLYRNGPLYHMIDAVSLPIAIHYKGLGMNIEHSTEIGRNFAPNRTYNRSFANSCVTAIAAAYATQLTDLAALTDVYTSDLPEMESGDNALVAGFVHYQSMVLNVWEVISAYNTLLSYQDRLVEMGFNAEAPQTIEVMNLLKKAQVFSAFEQLATVLHESFLDQRWANEIGVLANVPSRSFVDVLSPVKTITAIHSIPTLTITRQGESTPYYDSKSAANNRHHIQLDLPSGNPYASVFYTTEGLFAHVMRLLNPVHILGWSRARYFSISSMAYANYMSATAYINDLLTCISAITRMFATFNGHMADLKTLLMLLQDRTQLNDWVIGSEVISPSRPRFQADWISYQLVDNIFDATYSGGADLTIDQNTRKWRASSLWDYDRGIPEFDYREGGLTIAASVRDVEEPTIYNSNDPFYDFGIMFTRAPRLKATWTTGDVVTTVLSANPCYCFSRRGLPYYLRRFVISESDLSNYPGLARLNIINRPVGSIVVPEVNVPNQSVGVDQASCLIRLMDVLFNCEGTIRLAYNPDNDSGETGLPADGTNPYSGATPVLSSSVIGVVSREFSQFATIAEEYIRRTAPLRIAGGDATLGFRMH